VSDQAPLLDALTEGVLDCHLWLAATFADVSEEQALWQPPGKANPIAAVYAHVLVGADGALNGLLTPSRPLFAAGTAAEIGLSALPVRGDWYEWARGLRVDMGLLRIYAEAVRENWATFLASLAPTDIDRVVDLSVWGMGTRTLAQFLVVQIEHFSGHCGEIAALKGMQGATGYRPGTADGIG
jgi:hypothetical protein